ncbi:hypothetical protein [Streptomyces sp. ALI-76-A]|uniref:hypothetical protein n=1 Tax=Streptomyces sp. ALI-76-A TaxID=3025736 RepID=UPI00256F10D5|nr:hypothetical protein [Streptomyces sp. ALI-76-A]MDL5199780.1 hypothetical protein [Streptomyces sp. ALI-76-A]
MTARNDATDLDLLGWNLLNGGIDGEEEYRRERQIDFLASLSGLDLLWITEATDWEKRNRFTDLADATGLTALPYVTSHNGDGRNHSCLYYRADKLRLASRSGVLARGAFHHGVARAEFEVNGVRLLVLGAHLTYSSPDARVLEVPHLADYGRKFGDWPEDSVLIMDSNGPDLHDPEPEDWSEVPRNLWHRYRERLPDGSYGGWDTQVLRMLMEAGWRDPQADVTIRRKPTVGYWYENEKVPLHLDQALVTGQRIEVVDYRTLGAPYWFAPNIPTPDVSGTDLILTDLSDHLPVHVCIRLHHNPIRSAV